MHTKTRRYDLDWLRVIAILAVYAHHICMPFNGDDFHIMNTDSSKLLDDIMVFFEQFRLPLLFLISGTGTIFAFSKRTWIDFLKERSVRLLLPLFFGIFIIVPPQTFFENRAQYTSYWEIYTNADFEVNHLWFIENLFWMSIIAIPLILFLKSTKSAKFLNLFKHFTAKRFGLFALVIPLSVGFLWLKSYYLSNDKDLFNLSSTFFYSFFFVLGMLFASADMTWKHLNQYRKLNFLLFIISSVVFYTYYYVPGEWIAPYLTKNQGWMLWYLVCCLVGWSFVITLLGYGQIWFNKESTLVKKLNEAIYPFYILHQTVIVVFAYYIVQWEMPIGVKVLILLMTTFPVIIIIYRFFIYPFALTRILFGMKKR
ncbi:acyltransferase family protein [Kordia periserrulae]|uniref:acyltransferase family protein n=1 Tax=Kordia periserrulae TaxID=701523 RepID=UPI001304E3AF|nr:acyltransferase [Kordia periserrulae]